MNRIKNIILTTTSFLKDSTTPPNTPTGDIEMIGQINHLKSRKFFMTFVSVAILIFFYFSSVAILFFFSDTQDIQINAFVVIFSKVIEILAIIIGLFLGAQTAVDLKYNSNSSASISNESQNIKEYVVIEEYLSGPKEDDYTLDN